MDTARQFQMYHLNSVQLPRQMTSPTVSSQAANQGAEREPNVSVARPKRQKIAQACEPCRSRKVKCDGGYPVCGVCAKKKKNKRVECIYGKQRAVDGCPSLRAPTGDSETPHACGDIQTLGKPSIPSAASVVDDDTDIASSGQSVSSSHDVEFSGDSFFNFNGAQKIPCGADSMTGGIGSEGRAFFGSSSASSFMKQIKAAVDRKVGRPSRPPLLCTGSLRTPAFHNSLLPPTSLLDYTLPPRRTADELTAIYWESVHSLYPFLDKQRVEAAYASIWTGAGVNNVYDERLLVSTVDIMMALGCQFAQSIPPSDRSRASDVYFVRARELLQINFWEEASAELVQCLLLMGQYLQCSNSHHQCWIIVGHAARVAQSLGFHLPEFSAHMQSSMEREMARRIWHSCVLMDRILSMTMGRLAIIPKSIAERVPLPEDMDDVHLSRHTNEIKPKLPGETSMITFYIKTLQLYSIVNDTLLQFYSGGEDQDHVSDQLRLYSSTADPAYTAMLFKLDCDLMMWERELPSQLRISSDRSCVKPVFRRQAIICRCRFLHARILLLRPVLSRLCQPEADTPVVGLTDVSLIRQTIFQCSTLCLQAAYDLIEVIHTNLAADSSLGLLPAWWYCLYYIYTAATVLLAARLRPIIQASIPDHSLRESWKHAITILKSLECFGDSAHRCVAALEIMSLNVMTAGAETVAADVGSFDLQELGYMATGNGTSERTERDQDQWGDVDFNDVMLNMNDLSWLNSMPGSVV